MTTEVLKVRVEQEHIDEGLPRWMAACPVALALQAMGDPRAEVACSTARFHGRVWMLSPALRKFALDFDLGRPVTPGDYRLRAVVPEVAP